MRRLAQASAIPLTLAALFLLLPQTAWGQDSDEEPSLEELEGEAAAAYQAGEYARAITLMSQANQLQPHPNYLLNIAVSYSKLDDCTNATLWAQNALSSIDPPLPEEARGTARKVIKTCKERAKQARNTPPKTKPKEGLTDREITGWSLVAGGGAIFLGSMGWDLVLLGNIQDFEENGQTEYPTRTQYEDRQDALKTQRVGVVVGYTLGALVAAGGSWLLFTDAESNPEKESAPTGELRISPLIGPDQAGFFLKATY